MSTQETSTLQDSDTDGEIVLLKKALEREKYIGERYLKILRRIADIVGLSDVDGFDGVPLVAAVAKLAMIPRRQTAALAWVHETFGAAAMRKDERVYRVVEEVAELAQAVGVPRRHCECIIGYVYDRPAGDVRQEVGGVRLTLLSLAEVLGVDALEEEGRELARVQSLPADKFRARHAEKVAAGVSNVAVREVGK